MTRPAPDLNQTAKRLDIARKFGALMAAGHRAWREAVNDLFEKDGLTHTHFGVLHFIQVHGPLSQVQLAEHLSMEAQTLVRVIDAMEREGWVRRETDSRDRRVKRVTLAAKPERLRAVMAKFETLQLHLFSDLDNQQMELLLKMHEYMTARLQTFQPAPAISPAARPTDVDDDCYF